MLSLLLDLERHIRSHNRLHSRAFCNFLFSTKVTTQPAVSTTCSQSFAVRADVASISVAPALENHRRTNSGGCIWKETCASRSKAIVSLTVTFLPQKSNFNLLLQFQSICSSLICLVVFFSPLYRVNFEIISVCFFGGERFYKLNSWVLWIQSKEGLPFIFKGICSEKKFFLITQVIDILCRSLGKYRKIKKGGNNNYLRSPAHHYHFGSSSCTYLSPHIHIPFWCYFSFACLHNWNLWA